jgi:hypothetical protein
MSIYGVEEEVKYGDYKFFIAYDSGNCCSLEQRDIHWSVRQNGEWTEPKFVRSFYFEDVKLSYMKNFCRKFATDAEYREASVNKETDWAIRDGLFERNAFESLVYPALITQALGDVPDVWNFIKKHYTQIVAHPDYDRIKALDTAFEPIYTTLDPEIVPAVNAFNQITGVETQFSCQGVTGTIPYEGMEFLVDSYHYRYAYISFKTVAQEVEQQLLPIVQASKTMRIKPSYGFQSTSVMLQSTGDNLAFLRDAEALAQQLIKTIS